MITKIEQEEETKVEVNLYSDNFIILEQPEKTRMNQIRIEPENRLEFVFAVYPELKEIIDNKENIIKLLNEIKPKQVELEGFDETRSTDSTYCIEWGMKKANWLHGLVIERAINEI